MNTSAECSARGPVLANTHTAITCHFIIDIAILLYLSVISAIKQKLQKYR